MKFLLQENETDGVFATDFVYKTYEAIEYHNWLDYTSDDHVAFLGVTKEHVDQYFDYQSFYTYTPVGTIEFMKAVFDKRQIPFPEPRNVPECLFPFAGRVIENTFIDKNRQYDAFIKSNKDIKDPMNGLYTMEDSIDSLSPDTEYQISELIDIDDEYRVFVFAGIARGVTHYSSSSNDAFHVGNMNSAVVKQAIKVFEKSGEAPIAYTMDIGVNRDKTFVIEVHDYFSCGMYGWEGREHLLMLSGWYKEYLSKINFIT